MWRVIASTICFVAAVGMLGCNPPPGDDVGVDLQTDGAAVSAEDASVMGLSEAQEALPAESESQMGRLNPEHFQYAGAFRLPASGTGASNWEYSASAMTYYPGGDAGGASDGFPGSLFAVGHDHHQMVSEFSIPIPVISNGKQVSDLATATTLQEFADIRGGHFGELEIPRAGLEYLPSTDPSQPGKLHFCWGQHFQFEVEPSHGWSGLRLDAARTAGIWRLGEYTNYVTNDYLFEIPNAWADQHLPGYRLVTGRFRDGHWGGLGPALIAYRPPGESTAPNNGAVIGDVVPLLMYGRPQQGIAELEIDPEWKMSSFSESDDWTGGAWITRGERQSVILVGTKATGKTWYGFSNGVVYPTSGDPNEPVPEVPPFPHDARGWWSDDIEAQILFFDAHELAAVAANRSTSWTPQPYATLGLNEFLFDPGYDHPRQKRYSLGACGFDRANGILYIAERRVPEDEERAVIHVFRIQ